MESLHRFQRGTNTTSDNPLSRCHTACMNSRRPNFTQRRAVTISMCERDGVLCDSANASCAMLRLCDSVLSKAVIVQRRAVQHSGDVDFLQHDVELF